MIRLGLCCVFREEPIRFKTTTATSVARLPRKAQLQKLNQLCMENAAALESAVSFCAKNGIGAFRINSQILPLKTHPEIGYDVRDLPDGEGIIARFKAVGRLRKKLGLRLSFHPDQFVILNSPRPDVVKSSVKELAYQAEVAGWVGADVLNIHGGGAYGDKSAALERLTVAVSKLPESIRALLTFENDDRTFTPADLLPVCRATNVPLVYDVHHHRCLPDGLTEKQATDAAIKTWTREPLFHISSPRNGWNGGDDPKPHADLIDPADFPACWKKHDLTVEVEAKAKEPAVTALCAALQENQTPVWPGPGENQIR
jgi:UV DNA damage endonuclease